MLGGLGECRFFFTLCTTATVEVCLWFRGAEEYFSLLPPGIALFLFLMVFFHTFKKQSMISLGVLQENKHLMNTLQQTNTVLQQSNLAQSRYLSAASHDLRQPLHALALLTSDAQTKNQAPEVASTLEKIDQAIDSLSQSFNAVLNLSRLDSGGGQT